MKLVSLADILVAPCQLVDMLFELFSVDVASTLWNILYDV
jgi:hypothetical protein